MVRKSRNAKREARAKWAFLAHRYHKLHFELERDLVAVVKGVR